MKMVWFACLVMVAFTANPAIVGSMESDGNYEPASETISYGNYIEIVGDGHMHTTYSSGVSSVSEMAQKAQERGLDWIFITDGNTIAAAQNCSEETNTTFISGLGEEVMVLENSTYTNEIVAWGIDTLVDWYMDANHTIGDMIDEIHEQGGLAYIPHPFAPDEDDNYDYFGVYEDFDAMSIYHGYGAFNDNAVTAMDGDALRKWDEFLNNGIRKTAVGESDCKNADNTPDGGDLFNMRGAIGYPRNYVYAKEFSVRGIIEAVRYGRCYVTDGPTMNFTVSSYIMGENIYSQTPRQLYINISGNAVENSDVRIISNGAAIHSESVGPGAFSISYSHVASADAYFRAEIRTFNGDFFIGETNIAFSNPIYFDLTPYEDIPSPPSNLEAWVDGNDIVLNWTASNSSDVIHYYIYRSTTQNGFDFTYPHALTSKTTWTDGNAGDGDTTNYYYIVRAVDEKLYNDTNTVTAGKYVLPLRKGWNLVSTPLELSKSAPGDVLQTINDTIEIAQYYDASDGSDPWKDTDWGDLTRINNRMGIWINVNTNDYLITTGTLPKTTVIPLRTGWNLVGYPTYSSRNLTDALGSVFWDAVQTYRSDDVNSDFWKHSCPKKSGTLNDLGDMNTGSGFWIHATQDGQWIINN